MVFALNASALCASVWLSGCSGPCNSGERLVDGLCLAPCHDDACQDRLTCVRNVCRPECTDDNQCKGEDTCRKVRNDQGDVGRYCYGPALEHSPYEHSNSRPDAGNSNDTRCKTNAECPQTVAHECVDGSCETLCTLHAHCGAAGSCTGSAKNAAGQTINFCQPDTFPREPGQFGTSCLASAQSCDNANDFMCRSDGEGDTESYCTLRGCDSDAECPSGLFCSRNFVSARPPCVAACGLQGNAQNSDCIPEKDIGPGRPYRCSPNGGLELTVCLKRTFCTSCETDADCRAQANQVCARGPDGNKACTVLCTEGLGSCPWGNATQCGVFDEQLGQATCAPLFGACRGTGKSCEPCVHDGDCPSGFCSISTFTGERFCFDETPSCSCPSGEQSCIGGGCPLTPSGLQMNCVIRRQGEPPSVCYGAEVAEESATPLGCW